MTADKDLLVLIILKGLWNKERYNDVTDIRLSLDKEDFLEAIKEIESRERSKNKDQRPLLRYCGKKEEGWRRRSYSQDIRSPGERRNQQEARDGIFQNKNEQQSQRNKEHIQGEKGKTDSKTTKPEDPTDTKRRNINPTVITKFNALFNIKCMDDEKLSDLHKRIESGLHSANFSIEKKPPSPSNTKGPWE